MENLNAFEVMCLVYGRTLLKGGCSLTMWENGSHLEYAMPNTGFVVGGRVPERSIDSNNEAAFKHVFMHMHGIAERLTKEGKSVVLGTWVEHTESGQRIVFDLCDLFDNVESFKVPLEIAAKRGERAIYDLETEREIFVNTGA
jgi:hypothetical protein